LSGRAPSVAGISRMSCRGSSADSAGFRRRHIAFGRDIAVMSRDGDAASLLGAACALPGVTALDPSLSRLLPRAMDRERRRARASQRCPPQKQITAPVPPQAAINAAIERQDVTRLPAHARRHSGADRRDNAATATTRRSARGNAPARQAASSARF
jgi:hypothetical protein